MSTSFFKSCRRLIPVWLLACLLPGFAVFAQPALLRDIKPGSGSSDPSGGVGILNTYYFSADNGINGPRSFGKATVHRRVLCW
jgi:hypothetical protein